MTFTAAAAVSFMVGDPVGQTVLPGRINDWTMENGADALMTPLNISSDRFAGFVEQLRAWTNCRGCVVTAPHKFAALDAVDDTTRAARTAGAVNIIVRNHDGSLLGDNIDGAGFVTALRRNDAEIDGRQVLLFGCGGAGSSIAAALLDAGVRRMTLIDTSENRAVALNKRLGSVCTLGPAPEDVGAYDLVINATAIGLDGVSAVHTLGGIKPGAFVADVVTNPPMTPFLQSAATRGAHVQTGAEMAAGQVEMVLQRFGLI